MGRVCDGRTVAISFRHPVPRVRSSVDPAGTVAQPRRLLPLETPDRAAPHNSGRDEAEKRMRWILYVLAATLVYVVAYAKLTEKTWDTPGSASETTASADAAEPSGVTALVAPLPERDSLRYCCAFGTDLKVRFFVNLPLIRVGAIVGMDELGRHHYDGGGLIAEFISALMGFAKSLGLPVGRWPVDDVIAGRVEETPRAASIFSNPFDNVENNGLIYTCRAGFLDTSHVREQIDWVAYLIAALDRQLGEPGILQLPPEGAARAVELRAIPDELVAAVGRDELVVAMAQWIAYEYSVWHEIAQWYGWSLWELYPEVVSGFSPEDPISNVIGIDMMSGIDYRQELASHESFNRWSERNLLDALVPLGPVDASLSEQATLELDGLWWNSDEWLPDRGVVTRRYMDSDGDLLPWLFPDAQASSDLRARLAGSCGETPDPTRFVVASSLGALVFDDYATLTLTMNDFLEGHPALVHMGERFTHRELPLLVEQVRRENWEKYGPRAELPD